MRKFILLGVRELEWLVKYNNVILFVRDILLTSRITWLEEGVID